MRQRRLIGAAVVIAAAASVAPPPAAPAAGRLGQLEAVVAKQEQVLQSESRLLSELEQRHSALATRAAVLRQKQSPAAEALVAQQERVSQGEQRLISALEQRHSALEARTAELRARLEQRRVPRVVGQLRAGSAGAAAISAVGSEALHQHEASYSAASRSFAGLKVADNGWAQELKNTLMAQTLAALTGLKATVPLLVELFGQKLLKEDFPFQLREDFAWLGSWPIIILLCIFALAEIIGDAIPVIDEFMDLLMIVIKPCISVLIVVSQQNEDSSDARVSLLIMAVSNTIGVAMAKQASTMMLDVASGGIGAPVRSIIEDLISGGLAVLVLHSVIVAPIIIATSIAVSFAFCLAVRNRTPSKSAPYLASLCLWPEVDALPAR